LAEIEHVITDGMGVARQLPFGVLHLFLWSYSTLMNLYCALMSYLFDFVSSC
jgi:hypothetical protein